MSENKQMIQYKESFFTRLKQKIKSIFSNSNMQTLKEERSENSKDKESLNKEEIMKLYNDIKDEKIDLNTVESKDLYKIMLLLKEEIEIIENRVQKEIQDINIHYNNLKIYNKELQLLAKKDS